MSESGIVARVLRRFARRVGRISDRVEEEIDYQRGVVMPGRLGEAHIPDAENWTYYGEKPPWLVEQNDRVVQDALAGFERHEPEHHDGTSEPPQART